MNLAQELGHLPLTQSSQKKQTFMEIGSGIEEILMEAH